MTQHTPGPWKSNEVSQSTYDTIRLACAVWAKDGKQPICTTKFSVGKYKEATREEQDANARLIAAAPELLTALKELLKRSGETETDGIGLEHDSEALEAAYVQAEAAIAKAEGRA